MKGITLCADCAYYDLKKHKCNRGATVDPDISKGQDVRFYVDCPLDDVEPVRHWIPSSERLPGIKVPVLVTVYNHMINSYVRKIGAFLGDEWLISNIFSETMGNVVAWMPLPEAYEPPKEV